MCFSWIIISMDVIRSIIILWIICLIFFLCTVGRIHKRRTLYMQLLYPDEGTDAMDK